MTQDSDDSSGADGTKPQRASHQVWSGARLPLSSGLALAEGAGAVCRELLADEMPTR